MRIQTSLEFLTILGVVSAMALLVIGAYSNTIAKQSRFESSFLSSQLLQDKLPNGSSSSEIEGTPSEIVFMQQSSTVGQVAYAQFAFFNCSKGYANISANSSALAFPQGSMHIGVQSIGIGTMQFIPLSSGYDSAKFSYVLFCNGSEYSGNVVRSTYASYASSDQGNSSVLYSAKLLSRNLSLAYGLAQQAPIIYTTESSHCTYTNFVYTPLPIGAQCGTNNVWAYRVFSIWCYYNVGGTNSETTCIYPHNTSYATRTILSNYSLQYSLLLEIYTPIGVLKATLNNTRRSTPLRLYNNTVGYAEVANASYVGEPLSGGLLYNMSNYSIVNESSYSQYLTARSNMYSVLAYYNSTQSYSSQIYQAIYEYNESAQNLLHNLGKAPCSVSSNELYCRAQYPIDFVINAYVTRNISIGNATLQYLGSVINLVKAPK